ncbi:NIPSNAP family protein [uncultured Chitinophaga sp.]|jgi:NIPSNAP.|uniref:NIPSNAP family protein n=1 Tax=uncultured Chitinophaga sp. TaxID=339340 RepID=UPI0026281D5A|nr:NIPSNAP family protein [uncultured Chitinophaga sp.]
MILVHDIFIAKPGNGSKLAKLFKEVMSESKELVNVMTDVTGQFNKVVVVTKFDNLTAYENNWEEMQKDTALMEKMNKKMAGYHEMYLTGSREIYQIW